MAIIEQATQQPLEVSATHDSEKHNSADSAERPMSQKSDSDDSSFKQEGVRQVEAITSVWSSRMLWVTFIL